MALKKAGGPYVGLDIGTSLIKACEIDCKAGKVNLRALAVEPTPADAVTNNEVTDPVALGKALKHLFLTAGIKSKSVIASVAGQTALVVRIIEVPKMSRSELAETMKWEIERHVPFAQEQVVKDFRPLVDPEDVPEGQNMEVLLAVAQEGMVMRHVQAIQAAGLKPVAIDIEPLAASRALIDLPNGLGPAGTFAIIDLGANTSDISIYKDGRISFTRSIPIAGNTLTKAISDVLGRPAAEAEQLKRELASIPDQGAAPAGGEQDMFGGGLDFGGPDFGSPMDSGGDAGFVLGGTFGIGASPATDTGTSTATDTQSEPQLDIAGGGFSADAFTSPEPAAAEASPFDTPPATAAAPAPDAGSAGIFGAPMTGLAGPVPAANPFDPDAGLFGGGAAPAPAAPASPFEASPFGGDPFSSLGGFGMEQPAMAGESFAPQAPEMMSEEDYLKTQIADAIMPVLYELATELRRSLDFFRNRANGLGAQQVVLVGGTSKMPGLVDFLTVNLEVPAALGNPLQFLAAGPKVDPGYLAEVGSLFPVAVGLAARELVVEPPAKKSTRKAPRPKKK